MIKNYLKIAWRNLIKNKSSSFINIGGLAVGLACSLLIVLVGHLKPRARGGEVEMESVDGVGSVVDAVEDGFVVAVRVQGIDFGSVEIASAVGGVSGEEVAEALVADGK